MHWNIMSDTLKKTLRSLANPNSSVPTAPTPNLFDTFANGDSSLTIATGLYYRNQFVALDGYKFINCRFDNCHLVLRTSNFVLESCVIDPSCVVSFSEDLLKVIRLFNRNAGWGGQYPSFEPVANPDGTITIDKAK